MNFFSILLSGLMLLSICASSVYSQVVTVKHRVKPVSSFVLDATSIDQITGQNAITFATAILQNNTRDGFSLQIKSENGVLKPSSTADGEQDIIYTASVNSTSGESGLSIADLTAFVPAQSNGGTFIFDGTGISVSDSASLLNVPTDIELESKIAVSTIAFISMAGSYQEKFTFTYTDN